MHVVDGRGRDLKDVMLELRSFFKNQCDLDGHVEILFGHKQDAGKLKGFCAMSGCKTDFEERADHCALIIRERTCRCG